jgi:hypothetical protein
LQWRGSESFRVRDAVQPGPLQQTDGLSPGSPDGRCARECVVAKDRGAL